MRRFGPECSVAFASTNQFDRPTWTRARRSAMRVCQPGPVARHRETTSTGKRKEISCLGFADFGRPPFLTTAQPSMSSVSSGSSLYSAGLTTCASTRARSEPKVRGEACLFTIICLSHAKYVALCATLGVANHHHASIKLAVADDPLFTIVSTRIFNLDGQSFKHGYSIRKVQSAICNCSFTFRRIVGNTHGVIVYTKTGAWLVLMFSQAQGRCEVLSSAVP